MATVLLLEHLGEEGQRVGDVRRGEDPPRAHFPDAGVRMGEQASRELPAEQAVAFLEEDEPVRRDARVVVLGGESAGEGSRELDVPPLAQNRSKSSGSAAAIALRSSVRSRSLPGSK